MPPLFPVLNQPAQGSKVEGPLRGRSTLIFGIILAIFLQPLILRTLRTCKIKSCRKMTKVSLHKRIAVAIHAALLGMKY